MNVTLKLGKGAAFVKSRLRRLPQESEVWEADFLPKADYWMGLVIDQEHGAVFAMKMLETTPTVNDLAHLLSDAMRRPLFEVGWHRPRSIRLRDNPEWRELVPHLEELRIDVVFSEDLLTWDDAVAEYESPVKDLWLSQRSVQMEHDHIEESFPAIAAWVQHGGWIEIGDQDGVGFVARALDCGGLVYESDDCKSLGEALCSLQDGVARWFEQRGVDDCSTGATSEMNEEEPSINDRLAEVLNSILCPVAGCWSLHGGHSEYYFDTDAESHVLEVWPVGIEELEEHEGNGHHQTEHGLLYELAEFDFTELAKEVPLEHFHFSQRRSIFEIGWEENGQQLELRVHIVPVEVAEDI